jgi:transketolase
MRARLMPEFLQVALPDQFLDAGALPTLHDCHGISTSSLVDKIKHWLK